MRIRIIPVPCGDRQIRIILADEPEGIDVGDLSEQIYNDDSQRTLDRGDVLILRPPVIGTQTPDFDRYRHERFLRRFRQRPVHLLYSEKFQIQLSPPITERDDFWRHLGDQSTPQEFLLSLQNEELKLIARETSAILPPSENYFYRLPSGAATRMFLRVGNMQTSREIIDIFFFWLTTYLEKCTAIITDTWSISSIALNTSRLLARYGNDIEDPCRVEMISQYADDDSTREEIILRLSRIWPQNEDILLFLISAQMTGKFEMMLRSILAEHTFDTSQIRFVTLYKLTDKVECVALCDLSEGLDGIKFDALDSLQLIAAGESPIDIDAQTYFPQHFEEVLITVRNKVMKVARPFFERYRNHNIITVHHDPRRGDFPKKHRGIYIDVLRMLEVQAFRSRFENAIAKNIGEGAVPKVIISPPHLAGSKLRRFAADFIERTFGIRPEDFPHPSLNLEGDDLLGMNSGVRNVFNRLGKEDSILILDDTSQSGNRLERYQQNLWKKEFVSRIHYLVAVARPEDPRAWDKKKTMLEYRKFAPFHTVDYVEFLLLPQWSSDCPWCQEIEFLERHLCFPIDDDARDFVERRIEHLSESRSGGLSNGLFLTQSDDEVMSIGDHSLFLEDPCSDADVLAAVASSLQRLRTFDESGRQPLTPWRYPIAPVLDSVEYLESVFKSSILRAAFFRSTFRHEVHHVRVDREERRTRYIMEILRDNENNRTNISFEIFYHSAIGKLPKLLLTDDDRNRLDKRKHLEFARFCGVERS